MSMKVQGRSAAAAWIALVCTAGAYATDGVYEQQSFADNRPLRGAYGFSLTQSCVRTPFQAPPAAGFDPVTHQLLVDGEVINSTGTGVLRFLKNDQVALEEGFLVELSSKAVSAGQAPVSAGTKFVCTGTQVPGTNSRFTVSLTCEVLGLPAGQTVSLKPLNFEGFLGEDRRSLALTSAKNELHTVSVSVGGTVVQERERICLQSMKLDKLR